MMSEETGHQLLWPKAFAQSDVLIVLGPRHELQHLEIRPDGRNLSRCATPEGFEETKAASELRRALARCGSSSGAGAGHQSVSTLAASMQTRLERLLSVWLRTRRGVPLLRAIAPSIHTADSSRALPKLRLFVDRVGSNAAQVSWEVLGLGLAHGFNDGTGSADIEISCFEVEAHRRRSCSAQRSRASVDGLGRSDAVDGDESGAFESLGRFQVAGGGEARSYQLHRLRPLEWVRVRVRAVGLERRWLTAWSAEVSLKTLSVEAARRAGIYFAPPDDLFAPSERQIHSMVCGNAVEGILTEEANDASTEAETASALLPTAAEVARLRQQLLAERLDSAFGPAGDEVMKDLLDARLCKGGWQEFVRLGARYSRPAESVERRKQRMRLVIAAKERYDPSYADGNCWSMGPFYYEDVGRHTLESAAARRAGA